MRPIVSVDTETTGLHLDRRAWEVCAIRWDGKSDPEYYLAQIRSEDLDILNADPEGLRISRYAERHDQSIAEPEYRVMRGLWKITAGCTIIGSQPHFDTETLQPAFARAGLNPMWHYRLRCVTTLASGHLRADLGGLMESAVALGLPFVENQLHTAQADAELALAIYQKVMG